MSALRLGCSSVRFVHSYTTARVSYPNVFAAIRHNAFQQSQLTSFPSAGIRGYADKPAGRPKQHTGRAPARKTKPSSTATGKPAPSESKTTGAKPKAKTPAKKKKKPAKVKKVLTPEQITRNKEKAQKKRTQEKIETLKNKSLKKELPKVPQLVTAWNVYFAEGNKNKKQSSIRDLAQASSQMGARYRNFSPSEREHYNHLANQQNVANRDAYQKALDAFTAQQIKEANEARRALTKLGFKGYTVTIRDPKAPKRPLQAFARFTKDRHASGDLNGVSVPEAGKLIAQEWKELPQSAKQEYIDQYERELPEYVKEYTSAYGAAPPISRIKRSTT